MKNEQTPPTQETQSKFTPKRTRPQREADLQLIARLALRGHTQCEIRDTLNSQRPYQLTRSTIALDLGTLRRQWAESATNDTAEQFGQELAKLNHVETELWRHYEKTQLLRALDGIAKVIAQRVSLLGLSKPTANMEPAGPGGAPWAVLEVPEKIFPDRNA